MVEFLINKGINLQIRDKKNQTLIQEATKRKRPQMIELLVKNGATALEEEKKDKLVKPKPKV
jgi:hypothetical protein